jgi:hypothetical protein
MFKHKLIIFTFIALYSISSAVEGYVQLLSVRTQPLPPTPGVDLTYSTIGAIDSAVIGYSPVGSAAITLKQTGTYYISASIQFGFNKAGSCAKATSFFADFWIVADGADVENSNVQIQAAKTHKDVIVTSGIGSFTSGTKIKIKGAGKCAKAEFIAPKGEPAIPSIRLLVYKIA